MKQILVLAGGSSPEREISLKSGAAVAAALAAGGYQAKILDPANDNWQAASQDCDAVFPALHGVGGEDGEIQKILESLAVPFFGSGAKASALCFDKSRYKQLLQTSTTLMPRGELVDTSGFAESSLAKNPFVLKPYDGGSSVDTLIVREAGRFDNSSVNEIFARHPKMLLEELITGTEITVGILGDRALPVIEIIPPVNAEFDYENKYNGASTELCPPQNVSENLQVAAQKIALEVHQLCGCRDLSRSDFIINASGEIYLLETNTIPGLTEQSLFPKAASVVGITMPEAMSRLVELALTRA